MGDGSRSEGLSRHLGRPGSQETTVYRMVAAYAMFANGGERVEPTLVDRVQDRWGKTIFRHDKRKCEECLVASLDPGMAPRIVSNREIGVEPEIVYQLPVIPSLGVNFAF